MGGRDCRVSVDLWGRGVGRRALRLWTEATFATTDAQVVTLTTWSGNGRMIHCAGAVGYRECGRIPQARSCRGVAGIW